MRGTCTFVLSKPNHRPSISVLFCFLALLLGAQEEKRLGVYTPQTSYAVNVQDRYGREYVSVLELIQPLGTAVWKREGDKWRLGFGGDESQFQGGKAKAKIRGKNIDMGGPAIVENDVALVPVRGLPRILPRLLNATVEYREGGRRLIIAGVSNEFSAELQANPSRLLLHFSRPVNPSIASEPGHVRLTFTKDPVTAPAATQTFGDKLITSASFIEKNGAAELTVAANEPLLATFSDENRTITLAAAPQKQVVAQPKPAPAPQPAQAPAVAAATPNQAAPAPATAGPKPRFLVVIDPAHGGDDRGALLAAGVEEKELTLAFARRLRAALERSGVVSVLLRDGDTGVALEQRAVASNTARATIFISVHAGNVGRGVRVYTARVGEAAAKAGAMLPWDAAQAPHLDESKALAGAIAAELSKREIQHAEASAQLRPLNHVTAAAVAVEFLPGKDGVASLANAQYQQNLCAAIADAITSARNTLEALK